MKKNLQINKLIPKIFSKNIGANLFFFIVIHLLSFQLIAQLPDFNLQVIKTDEICPGNGTLTFNTTNTAAGATLNFKVYKLPDSTTAIANSPTNFLGGLSSATYRVIATQTTSGGSSNQTAEVTIDNNTNPINFELSSTSASCGNDAQITVNILSGNAVSYEIMAGPVIRPPQTSNQFILLPEGVYRIRVYDSCGEAFVQTRTIFRDEINFLIDDGVYPETDLTSCNFIDVMHSISATSIRYPLQYIFTIYPPGGSSSTITGTITSGTNQLDLIQALPVMGQDYNYTLQIIDSCNSIYIKDGIVKSNVLKTLVGSSEANCGIYSLLITPLHFIPPYTINFISTPVGFNPADFNASHPGPFYSDVVEYFDLSVSVPFGTYTVEITDSCGRSNVGTYTMQTSNITPSVKIVKSSGCSPIADVEIIIPGRNISSATIENGPSIYPHNYPHVVTNLIVTQNTLVLDDLPVGTYSLILVDVCGTSHPIEVIVTSNSEFYPITGQDCEIGKGTILIGSVISRIDLVEITSAPAGFAHSLPYNVSFNIRSTGFTMNSLPAGAYTFRAVDECGGEILINSTIIGYAITRNEYEIIPHCGTFDLNFHHDSNGLSARYFWLQKFNPITNTWGHPETNVAYTDGSLTSPQNSLSILNNVTNFNLAFFGTFRILKSFKSIENGSIGNTKYCIETIKEFDFTGHPEIVRLKSLTCNGVVSEVEVFAEGGVPPYIYEITKRNSVDFYVDNGSNNIFSNLGPNIYTFKVTDACGEFRSKEFNVAELPPLATANQAEILLCDDTSQDGIEIFPLSSIDDLVLGPDQPSSEYRVKYYRTSNEAINQQNSLPENFSSTTKIIFARVDNLSGIDCFAIAQINLKVLEYPKILLSKEIGMCDNNPVTVTANTGFDTYEWSNNDADNQTTFDTPGNYSLKVTKIYGSIICEATHDFEIINSTTPVIKEVITSDWTTNNNVISVTMNEIGDYEYSIDNIHFQDDSTFYGLEIGQYTVYVRSKLNCGIPDFEKVHLLSYPKFFTPNGDGFNDFWRVKLSFLEPNMMTYIFDRYGKLITGFDSKSAGWDGTLNGKALPSTDYWFLVKREDGRIHRGHFAMKR